MFVKGSSNDELYILNNCGKREKRQIAEKKRERERERDNRERGKNCRNGNREIKGR